jgi:hypothetical protein
MKSQKAEYRRQSSCRPSYKKCVFLPPSLVALTWESLCCWKRHHTRVAIQISVVIAHKVLAECFATVCIDDQPALRGEADLVPLGFNILQDLLPWVGLSAFERHIVPRFFRRLRNQLHSLPVVVLAPRHLVLVGLLAILAPLGPPTKETATSQVSKGHYKNTAGR